MSDSGRATGPGAIALAVADAAGQMPCVAVCWAAPAGLPESWCGSTRRAAERPEAALGRLVESARRGSRSFAILTAAQLAAAMAQLHAFSQPAVEGGVVLAVADALAEHGSPQPPGLRSLARTACLPLLEPADPQEGRTMSRLAFELSEEFCCPVLIRLPAEDDCQDSAAAAADCEPARAHQGQVGAADGSPDLLASARVRELANFSNVTGLNTLSRGPDRRLGLVTAGPSDRAVREAFPRSPIVKMGLSYPPPMKHLRGLAEMCRTVVVVAEGGMAIAAELRGEGFCIEAHDPLPRGGHLPAALLRLAPSRRDA